MDQLGVPRPRQPPPCQFCQDQSHFLLLLFGWVGAVLLHPPHHPAVPWGLLEAPQCVGEQPLCPNKWLLFFPGLDCCDLGLGEGRGLLLD